ncbi:MAG: HEAT repeat domain-containing protein [Sandaracinaceae bacterium]|nr:HEAT repeat domain-containing protein [Sandaracinaceae bacterium]
MAGKTPVDAIVKMLSSEAPERRLAAVIVLGELQAKKAVPELTALLGDGAPSLQRHALDALCRIGLTQRALGPVWPLLGSRDADVRTAATEAIASVGEGVVGEVQVRLGEAEGDERRALEGVLSRLGGAEAFDVLLAALAKGDEESNRATALELRRHVRDADAKTRKSYRTRLERFLKKDHGGVAAAAAVKVLGFLEDRATAPTLLALARDAKQPAAVRQEALIALRFTMAEGADKDLLKALVDAAAASDRSLAQTALMTLAAIDVPATHAPALARLALHPDLSRAQMAIEKLGSLGGKGATETLVEIVARGDKRRAELAAAALEDRADALAPLVELLAKTDEQERAKLLRQALRSRLGGLTPAMKKQLASRAVEALVEDAATAEPLLSTAREAGAAIAEPLRAQAAKVRKGRNREAEMRALAGLVKIAEATPEERYRLATLHLVDSHRDPRTRGSDRGLRLLSELQRGGFDVATAMRKDRGAELETLYYVGFCFLEDDVDGGEELLREVVDKGGRKKIGKAAKNKLALEGIDEP